MRGGKMKKIVSALITVSLLLCGCGESYPRMQQLPPESFPAHTSSTYTGTTVDFVYVSTKPTPKLPSKEFEMPEFSDINGIENPFDETFSDLFTSAAGETVSVSFDDISYDNDPISETSAGASSSDTETAVTAAPEDPSDTVTETVSVSDQITVSEQTQVSERFLTPYSESFDINEYLPSSDDYPQFESFDIYSLF